MKQHPYYLMGQKLYRAVTKMDYRWGEWDLFEKSFGFFQWKKKNNPTEEQLEQMKQGWLSLENRIKK